MGTGILTIDTKAVVHNWQSLNKLSDAKTGAVIKANAYGLGAKQISRELVKVGVDTFFVALADEAILLRNAIGPKPIIYVLSGHNEGETDKLISSNSRPVLNSLEQLRRHQPLLNILEFAIQIDTGMNRLGIKGYDWDLNMSSGADFIMSHLACADEPLTEMNEQQLTLFKKMTFGAKVPLSLAATGGILLDRKYHFDIVRPGIGIYGCSPYKQGRNVVSLDLPVIQVNRIEKGEAVGYGKSFIAKQDMKIATIALGYADGVFRSTTNKAVVFFEDIPCKLVGRISMDMITVDVSHLKSIPKYVNFIGSQQTVDQLAKVSGTIGYEILTSLGSRYKRIYK
ncbi:MAG: alanine racemase [Proteobacteria bacterium]|jgi:alanine racemase|nr:alanine racemase [Pseudomonadota bacterium]MDA1239137.1 alanine racemase [Pseudomonadota bacterium]